MIDEKLDENATHTKKETRADVIEDVLGNDDRRFKQQEHQQPHILREEEVAPAKKELKVESQVFLTLKFSYTPTGEIMVEMEDTKTSKLLIRHEPELKLPRLLAAPAQPQVLPRSSTGTQTLTHTLPARKFASFQLTSKYEPAKSVISDVGNSTVSSLDTEIYNAVVQRTSDSLKSEEGSR